MISLRNDVLDFATRQLGCAPDSPWPDKPGYLVLHHPQNNKWVGIIMNIPARCMPESGAMNAEETIISPASTLAPRMVPTVWSAEEIMETSGFMYDPYVIMIATATDSLKNVYPRTAMTNSSENFEKSGARKYANPSSAAGCTSA